VQHHAQWLRAVHTSVLGWQNVVQGHGAHMWDSGSPAIGASTVAMHELLMVQAVMHGVVYCGRFNVPREVAQESNGSIFHIDLSGFWSVGSGREAQP
jgi:hypothetical protein